MTMCSDLKETPEGKPYTCRRCDDCIAARRADWVSRCMAEKATSKFTTVLALTYNDETEENRTGAMMFRYSDIQAFIKRLRQAIYRKHKIRDSIRYVCAGEQGDQFGRCHWHLVLYSKIDLWTLGVLTAPWGVVSDRNQIVTPAGVKPYRRGWSLWGRGFVTFQEPDEGGIKYAITYALKDQFAHDKAKGQNREAKSETWATGLFRPSKKPPIGFHYLEAIVKQCADSETVLPHTRITIPKSKHYWRPVGALRKYLLTSLREVNERYKQTTGRNCAQWSSLVKSCENSEQDMEWLGYGTQGEILEDEICQVVANQRDNFGYQQRAKTARSCGSKVACSYCLRGHRLETLNSHGIEPFTNQFGEYAFRYSQEDAAGFRLKADQHKAGRGHNPLCQKDASSPEIKRAFPNSARSR